MPSLSCFIREFLAPPSSATGKKNLKLRRNQHDFNFGFEKLFLFHDRRRWWWWWHGIGEMWKWGSEINKFCKNFFVLTLDHRWAAATGSSLFCSSLFFSWLTQKKPRNYFFCYVRANRSTKSADKARRSFNDYEKKCFELSLIISWSSPIFLMCHDEVPNVYWTSMEF